MLVCADGQKYICQAELGVETDTGNADGRTTQTCPYGKFIV